MDFGMAAVAAITAIAYLLGLAVKQSPLENRWIPVFCGVCGGVLGIVCLYTGVPDFPAGDPVTAAAVGVVSGLAATGVNELYRHMKQ